MDEKKLRKLLQKKALREIKKVEKNEGNEMAKDKAIKRLGEHVLLYGVD